MIWGCDKMEQWWNLRGLKPPLSSTQQEWVRVSVLCPWEPQKRAKQTEMVGYFLTSTNEQEKKEETYGLVGDFPSRPQLTECFAVDGIPIGGS